MLNQADELLINTPLAAKVRPTSIEGFFGQKHVLAPGKPLYEAYVQQKPHSMILWGPPGTGKTTLAMMLASVCDAHIEKLSAVSSGVKEVKAIVVKAQFIRQQQAKTTLLFIDEIHRFNKAQQDAFLPYVEDGTLILIGATTENPSFSLNNALLSRVQVYVLQSLTVDDLVKIIDNVLKNKSAVCESVTLTESIKLYLAKLADGDARRLLNMIDLLIELSQKNKQKLVVDQALIDSLADGAFRRFDNGGDDFYNQISALHKSIRGSSPDGALYWFSRMIDGGIDPLYIARRLLRVASEDVGNADPRGITLALSAYDVYQRLGSPEGLLAISQVVTYLACAPKSNAVYLADKSAMADVKRYGSLPVPKHLCNAPTSLMKQMDYGKNYCYPHDQPNSYAPGVSYFPEELKTKPYYMPTENGLEIKIKQKLNKLKQLDESVKSRSRDV